MGESITIFLQGRNNTAIQNQLERLENLINRDFPNRFNITCDGQCQVGFAVTLRAITNSGIDCLVDAIENREEYIFCSVYSANN